MTQYAKGHYRAIPFTIEMLVSQHAFLHETQTAVEIDRPLIEIQRLPANLVQA